MIWVVSIAPGKSALILASEGGLNNKRTAELLSIILDHVSVVYGQSPIFTEVDQTILMARMMRAFRSLPDGASLLLALQFVEGLAARSPRSG